MLSIEDVAKRTSIRAAELHLYIQQSWVLPMEEEGRYFFDDADVARIQLIYDLRTDMGCNDEAVPVVLNLVDQLHSMNRALEEINQALNALSPGLREEIEETLKRLRGG